MSQTMKKLLGILVLGLLWSGNSYADTTFSSADSITTFKCSFEKKNYEYTINLYNDELNDVHIKNSRSKKTYHYNRNKKSADITVILGDQSYNFKGFKNNDFGTLDHYLFFTDRAASLYAYLAVKDYKGGSKPKSFYITSFDSALDYVTEGTCEAIY